MLTLEGVTKRFDNVCAVDDVSIDLHSGRVYALVGPNGAGKTTLIKILCTLVLHDEGEVYINGHDPKRETREVLKNLQAVLPESRGFNWRLTGKQNLEFYALLYGLSDVDARQRIKYLLDFTGLTMRADDGIQRYSTGMQRRLLLCRALLRDTPIIVFDEPTSGLDPSSGAEFRRMIIDRLAREEGKTVLLSTHNLQEAQGLCDRLAILERGKVIAMNTPDNIRHLVIEDRLMRITLAGVTSVDNRLVNVLQKCDGVHRVDIEYDRVRELLHLTLRVAKEMDLSNILKSVTSENLKIYSVNVEEPSLEDAFNAITGRDKEQGHMNGGA